MNRKRNWGIAALIVFVIAAGGFIYWQLSSVQQLKEQLAQDAKRFEKNDKPKTQHVISKIEKKPPDEPGFEWVRHGNHWDKVPVSEQVRADAMDTAEYGITRQGKRYKKNPVYADDPVATAIPTGPPLNIEWQNGGHPKPGGVIDWRDPRTWESYRNFWGFEPPDENPQTGREYTPRLDNWGTPLQNFRGTFIVTHYKKRIGFCPSSEQLAEYKQLQAQLETARANGDNLRADSLQQDIRSLMNSARGELPIKHTFHAVGYGPAGFADDPEKEKALIEASERDVYKRMGIEHLYEFYEKK